MKIRLLGPVLLLACSSAVAQSGQKWLEVHTPHFTVLSNSGERDARHVASQFERMRTVFHIIMPSATDDPASPIQVLALKDRKSFRTLEPEAYLGKNSLDLAGLFVRTQDKNYVLLRLDAEGEHPYATVYHEYTHYLFRKADPWMPLWLGEGLAEFYQNTDLDDKYVKLGEPSADDILYLRQQKLLPLKTLLTVDHNSPYYHDEQKGSIFYSESWALTHYLKTIDAQQKTHRLQDYADHLQKNEDSLTAAQHAFGDLGALEKALDQYVSGMSFSQWKLVNPVDFTEASFDVRPVPESEAEAIEAGVLLSVRRGKEAEAMLQTVLAADPKNALAHETMGELKLQADDVPGAKKWFGEAVQLDSKSYLANYYFAAMSMQDSGAEDEAIEQSLQTSIKLNPRFAPAYDALARFYGMHHEKLGEAHMMTLHAVQLEPETLAYRLNAANVLMEDHKPDIALNVLEAALPVARTDEERILVKSRITQLTLQQKYAAEAEARRSARAPAPGTEIAVEDARPIDAEIHGTKVIAIPYAKAPDYPTEPTKGPNHTVTGVLREVKCAYPSVLTLTLDRPNNPLPLYAADYFKITFTTAAGYNPKGDILPCTGIEGLKARLVYGEVEDKRVAGQIVAIELSK